MNQRCLHVLHWLFPRNTRCDPIMCANIVILRHAASFSHLIFQLYLQHTIYNIIYLHVRHPLLMWANRMAFVVWMFASAIREMWMQSNQSQLRVCHFLRRKRLTISGDVYCWDFATALIKNSNDILVCFVSILAIQRSLFAKRNGGVEVIMSIEYTTRHWTKNCEHD